MLVPNGATIAVADGEKLNLFRNSGDETNLRLTALPAPDVESDNRGSGMRHHSSAANPDESQQEEDSFAAGIADILNSRVLSGKIESLIVVAAPRTLGELRKHYHRKLSDVLIREIAKDLTGHSVEEVEKSLLSS